MSSLPKEQYDRLDYQRLQADEMCGRTQSIAAEDWKPLYWSSVSTVGTGLAWAVQYAYCTPTLRTLGMSDSVVNYSWLAGPITGIIVQPIVGVYNDHSTSSWGRRRPTMLIGAVMTAIGLQLFCNAESLGYWFSDTSGDHTVAIVIALLALWMLDASINVMSAPQRALLSDLFPDSKLPLANGFVAMHMSLGYMLGYGLAACDLTSWSLLSWMGTNVRALYTLAAVVTLACVFITCATTPERQHHLQKGEPPPRPVEVLGSIFRGVAKMPRTIRRAFVVQSLAFVAWFFVYVYASDWMGETVFGGSADSDDATYSLYEDGVEAASLGCALMAAGSVGWSLCIPRLCNWFGARIVWGCCLGVFSVVLLCTLAIEQGQVTAAVALLGVLSIPCAATQSIPWSIVTQEVCRTNMNRGLFTAVFNLSQAFMEIFVALIGGFIYAWFGSVASDLAAGGVVVFIAMCMCYFVIDPGAEPQKAADGREQPSRPPASDHELAGTHLNTDDKHLAFL